MFTMATAVRVVTDWLGDPGAVVEYGVRFTRPVVVDVGAPTCSRSPARCGRWTPRRHRGAGPDRHGDGETVLAKARVTVRLAVR